MSADLCACKERGICPSCAARRAAETAAHLVDAVLPLERVRQWVLSLPFDLNHRVALDEDLETAILDVWVEELFACVRASTGEPRGVREPSPLSSILAVR